VKYGIDLVVSGTGNGDRYGINSVMTPSGNANRVNYGIRSRVGSTGTTLNQTNYGISSEIGTPASRGTKYAVYAVALHDTAAQTTDFSYSGWFQGDRFAIRNATATTGYDLTTATGDNGAVLTSNGAGGTNWSNKSIVRGHINSTWLAADGTVDGTYLVIPFNAESIDTKNEYDTTAHTFTALNQGYYRVTVQVSSNDYDGDSTHGLAIYKGTNLVTQDVRRHTNIGGTSEDNINRVLSDIIQLNAGETIQFRFNDNNATFGASIVKNFFTIQQL
jgi:hypothetical protein